MGYFLAPHSKEGIAHSRLSENWDFISYHSFDELLVAHCASYHAFDRYLSGEDLIIFPHSLGELERVLRRHAYDSIHNAISRSRQVLNAGGYGRTCHLAEQSIRKVLSTNDNTTVLLAWHRTKDLLPVIVERDCTVPPITV